MLLILDTSVISALMRRDSMARSRIREVRPGQLGLCAPAAAEIRYGLDLLTPGSRRRRNLEVEYERLRELVRWFDWTEPAAIEFGHLKARLRAHGKPIDDMDVAIASIATVHSATVATYNARDFKRVPGLGVENWSADPAED